MEENITKEDILEIINYNLKSIQINNEVISLLDLDTEHNEIVNKLSAVLADCQNLLNQNDIRDNYLLQISNDINSVCSFLFFKYDTDISHIKRGENIIAWKNNYKNLKKYLPGLINKLRASTTLFRQLNFYSDNIVVIGANGSGKSSLSNIFKAQLSLNGVSISAQRILNISELDHIKNTKQTQGRLKEFQTRDKTNKSDRNSYLENEFTVILDNLVAENVAENATYKRNAKKSASEGKPIQAPALTILEKTLMMWNSLIEHRVLICEDGINIKVKTLKDEVYESYMMSDGEKVVLFLIAQALQAPENGFIIIDEPEIYLHKAILKKLWDRLEKERQDCIFIYLTHDVDFATSRVNAKKIWIKSYTHPDEWELEPLPTDELPEALLMELLGSRKKILFCEGQKGSLDEQIFNILYPELTIAPVGSCSNVISYTRAFNKLKNTHAQAYGIIDADFHSPAEIATLKADSIFTYNVAEIENLFLDEGFLKFLSSQLMKTDKDVEKIKQEIITQLKKDTELQIANYISAFITYLYTTSHVKKGNTIEEVTKNLTDFNASVKIDEWKKEREAEINQVVASNDYAKAILLYNNKGLKGIANKVFSITDFTGYAMSLLIQKDEAKNALKKYFPIQLG